MFCQRGMLAAARLAAKEEGDGALRLCWLLFALNLCTRER